MKQLTPLERRSKCVYVNADLLLYHFRNTEQDFQTLASTCFFILAYLSVLFIMKPTQMRRDIYYVLFISQCIIQIWKYCFPEEIPIYF